MRYAAPRDRREEAVSAWFYALMLLVDGASALYQGTKEAERHLESCDPLRYAMCPRCKTVNALSDWKCPSCKGALSFDVHRVEDTRKVFGNCAACGVYAPDFKCTACTRNMTDRF